MTPDQTLQRTRRALLILLVFGLAGTAAELLLMGHTEGFWQLLPLFLIAAAFLGLGAYSLSRAPVALHAFRWTMFLALGSGVAGALLHYRGNVEFEQEMMPGIRGFALFRESMSGATPALAPGTMILLGVLGLVYTYRHPALDRNNPVSKE